MHLQPLLASSGWQKLPLSGRRSLRPAPPRAPSPPPTLPPDTNRHLYFSLKEDSLRHSTSMEIPMFSTLTWLARSSCLPLISHAKCRQQAAFPLSQYLTLYFIHFYLKLSSSRLYRKRKTTSSSSVRRSSLGCLLSFDSLSPLPILFFSGRLLNASSRKKSRNCHFYFKNPVVFFTAWR